MASKVSHDLCTNRPKFVTSLRHHGALSLVWVVFARAGKNDPLSLDVGQLFRDETVLHLEDIDATDMALFSCRIDPVVFPAHNTPYTKAENLLNIDMGVRRIAEEVLPKLR